MTAAAFTQVVSTSPPADHVLLLDAVRAAGALALQFFGRNPKTWEKSKDNPVSEADLAVNELLFDRLMAARPDYGWLSEESPDDPNQRRGRPTWVVDPIDGTKPFLKGVAEFAVAVALVDCGRPVAACVYNPATEELFEAFVHGGARLNGTTIAVSLQASIADAKLLISKYNAKRAHNRALTDTATSDVGSIAYRIALVACGRYDAVISLAGKNDWDIAGADLLIAEAGGRISAVDGRNYQYNGDSTRHRSLVAANPELHGQLCSMFVHTLTEQRTAKP